MSKSRHGAATKPYRRVALLGVAAILLQAILFGWHHHPLALAGVGSPIASLHNATQPLAPAAAEELCEICAALHHQSASPLAVAIPPQPSTWAVTINLPDADPIGRAYARGFHARAPPRA
jgi:hypothetical protein